MPLPHPQVLLHSQDGHMIAAGHIVELYVEDDFITAKTVTGDVHKLVSAKAVEAGEYPDTPGREALRLYLDSLP